MKNIKYFFILSILFNSLGIFAQENESEPIQTTWAKEVNAKNVWQEYPRPQLKRKKWKNLNGYWNYAIADKNAASPEEYKGKILVPFCVESKLSGVQKKVTPDQKVWYNTSFKLPNDWNHDHILLHFDAVDWETKVWVNGKLVGEHKGGSDPFSFDITTYLKKGEQNLQISVWDPTDTGTQPRGKQVLDPKSIWYTAVTGIWQTVWLEPVKDIHIESINPIADIDNKKVTIKNKVQNASANTTLNVVVKKNGKEITKKSGKANDDLVINIPDPELWFPENPFLYELVISVESDGKKMDEASSYFAMRKISKQKDELGYERIFLNNEPRFQYGTLDQGWWPGGLLTPPSDKAMRYDMDMLKKMGFNMLRKHIKVEPSRYYYHADKIGLLIWQDMVTGFKTSERKVQHVSANSEKDWDRPKVSADQFENEWKAILDHLKFFPSIVTWVTFNEGWGQYDTERIVKWTQQYDPTRLVDGVSGWADRKVGDMNDAHHYPGPGMEPAAQNPGRIIVLGEFGGLGLPVQGHLWNPNMRNWGYRTYHSTEELKKQYSELIHNMSPMVNNGLSAAIYTQTTDVEGEVNGLITYDRKVVKMDPSFVKNLNETLYRKPKKITVILKDSEVQPQEVLVYNNQKENGNDSKSGKTEFAPVTLENPQNATLQKQFDLDGDLPENLQLRVYGVGDIEVMLNGKTIVDKFIRTKRHYDEINISEYSSLLKNGKNTLTLSVNGSKGKNDFDFGLYTF